jgi:hypothetical protein
MLHSKEFEKYTFKLTFGHFNMMEYYPLGNKKHDKKYHKISLT